MATGYMDDMFDLEKLMKKQSKLKQSLDQRSELKQTLGQRSKLQQLLDDSRPKANDWLKSKLPLDERSKFEQNIRQPSKLRELLEGFRPKPDDTKIRKHHFDDALPEINWEDYMTQGEVTIGSSKHTIRSLDQNKVDTMLRKRSDNFRDAFDEQMEEKRRDEWNSRPKHVPMPRGLEDRAVDFGVEWAKTTLIDALLSTIDKRDMTNPAVTAFVSAAMALVTEGEQRWSDFFAVVAGLAVYRNYDRITADNLFSLLPDDSKWSLWSWFGYGEETDQTGPEPADPRTMPYRPLLKDPMFTEFVCSTNTGPYRAGTKECTAEERAFEKYVKLPASPCGGGPGTRQLDGAIDGEAYLCQAEPGTEYMKVPEWKDGHYSPKVIIEPPSGGLLQDPRFTSYSCREVGDNQSRPGSRSCTDEERAFEKFVKLPVGECGAGPGTRRWDSRIDGGGEYRCPAAAGTEYMDIPERWQPKPQAMSAHQTRRRRRGTRKRK
jgi:hypothetical protein